MKTRKLLREIKRPFQQLKHIIVGQSKGDRSVSEYFEDPRLYRPCTSEEQRDVFKKYVQTVEIEIFSFCNRKCGYCPNVHFDRHSQNIFMSEDVFQKIINDLGEIDYSQTCGFNCYNEPLADKIVLLRTKQLLAAVPKAKILLFTNGDYLTQDYLEELADSGIHGMCITLHLSKDETYSQESADKKIRNFTQKFKWKMVKHNTKHARMYLEYGGMKIKLHSPNYYDTGTTRGLLVNKHLLPGAVKRKAPCFLPARMISFWYDGSCTSCCHLYAHAPDHQAFVSGNVSEQNIFELYNSKLLQTWRKSLSVSNMPALCENCHAFEDVSIRDNMHTWFDEI